jgi:hypothetical protein
MTFSIDNLWLAPLENARYESKSDRDGFWPFCVNLGMSMNSWVENQFISKAKCLHSLDFRKASELQKLRFATKSV